MPSFEIGQKILELNQKGLSSREIARRVGVDKSTVNRVLAGQQTIQPESKISESGDSSTVEVLTSEAVKTEADAIRVCEVDTTTWRVKKFSVKLWTTSMKVRRADGSEKPTAVQNYRVSLDLERIKEKPVYLALEGVLNRIRSHAPKYATPKVSRDKILNAFCLFDVHFGKLAWQPETGSNYDLDIADTVYRNAVVDLLNCSARNSSQFLLPIGNDFFHIDNHTNTTTAGTRQDTDSRLAKIIEKGELAVIWAVEELQKVAPVHVTWVPGNHDYQTSFQLARTVWAWFARAKHVTVDTTPTSRKYHRFGCNLLGFTHGNEEKISELPMIMANERPKDFGETTTRHWLIGHQHQSKSWMTKQIDTSSGVEVHVCRSLAGTDSWHYRKGYLNMSRSAESYQYSFADGFVGKQIAKCRE
jgi:hypothetical protein